MPVNFETIGVVSLADKDMVRTVRYFTSGVDLRTQAQTANLGDAAACAGGRGAGQQPYGGVLFQRETRSEEAPIRRRGEGTRQTRPKIDMAECRNYRIQRTCMLHNSDERTRHQGACQPAAQQCSKGPSQGRQLGSRGALRRATNRRLCSTCSTCAA